MKHQWLWGGIFGVLAIAACTSAPPEEAGEGPNPLPKTKNVVDTTHIHRQPFTREIISNGKLRAAQKAGLAFETGGRLAHIPVENGQYVSKGSVLAVLDTTSLRQSLNKARQQFLKTEVALRDLLIGQGYSPQDTNAVPGKFLRIAKLKSGYQEAALDLRKARRQLQQAVLKAPFAGQIANLKLYPHERVASGETVCTLISGKSFKAGFHVLETERSGIHMHQPVLLQPLSGGKAKGRISAINPVVNKHGMIQVTASLTNPQIPLMDGMHVKVFVQQPVQNQLVIPKSALLLRQNKEVVFTLKNDTIAMWNYVQTGHENSHAYTITEGLNPGDAVITRGNINLAHETIVEVAKEKK